MTQVTEQIQEETKQEAKPVEKAEEVKAESQETETQEQINWKRFREEREKERRAKIESDRVASLKTEEAAALKAAMESLLNKPMANQPVYQTDGYTQPQEGDEDRIKRLVREQIENEKAQFQKEAAEREKAELPAKLSGAFNDFNHVCSTDNLDWLEYHHPELAKALGAMPESFNKWANISSAIKRYIPNPSSSKEVKKAEKNMQKPQSMNIGGITQTGDVAPQNLTEQKRAANWARMQRAMKGG